MDNQNLNNSNQNNSNLNNQFNTNNVIPNNNQINQNSNLSQQIISGDIEVLGDDLMSNSPNPVNSFVKAPEITTQDPNELLSAVPKPDMMISSPTNNMISTEELIEDFIGKNYDKIAKRKFNLSAFFFTSFYFLFRKMYLYGIIINIIILTANIGLSLINPFISLIFDLLISLVLCFMFNKIYINYSKGRVEKIKKTNTTKSISDLSRICSKKGGTSLLIAFVISMIISSVITGIIISLMPNIFEDIASKMVNNINFKASDIDNKNKDEIDNSEDSNSDNNNDDNSFNGTINYKEDIIIDNKIEMGFLQIFTPSVLNADYKYAYEYQTVPEDDNSKCSFTLGVVDKYNTGVELINEMANYYNISNEISTISTNKNLTWNRLNYEENLSTIYYNAIDNNENVYLLTYEIPSTSNSMTCEAFYNGIINSIEFKE